eukprot:CAMPEP_0179137024 /NCGR_PEP_ID=MMETSP0796-20121207/65337_1 /TAXON_ID=73915 /ORGANISM="Pyrodinium bahamense, Strain pbaha01" /LENGTH=482 /DNA_ID=CAMNT_0020836163 /DNA_START=7 /DNA_END=1452 /DNA_ORIENTATION=-
MTGPLFGRFADDVDRRFALIVYGFITFLPTFAYWFFRLRCLSGEDTCHVVFANHIASIFAAVGRSSNVAFALSADVTDFEDRTLAAGVFYGMTNCVVLLLSLFPAFFFVFLHPGGLQSWYRNHPRVVLYYQAGLVGAFVVLALSIAKPVKRVAEDDCQDSSDNNNSARGIGLCQGIRARVDVVKLVKTDERLRRLSFAAFFLSLSCAISMGNDGQYFAQVLHLRTEMNGNSYTEMNVLRSLGAHSMVMPGFLLTGYFAMKTGTLKLLRRLVPVTAATVASGALMLTDQVVMHSGFVWLVPVVVAVQTLSGLYQVPLMRLAAGVARPGRIGTWLTVVGMAVECGRMLGNLVIILTNELMIAHTHHVLLWRYYPAAGVVALFALLFLSGKPKLAIGWGAAAGGCKEQLEAVIIAHKVSRHWKRKAFFRRALPLNCGAWLYAIATAKRVGRLWRMRACDTSTATPEDAPGNAGNPDIDNSRVVNP